MRTITSTVELDERELNMLRGYPMFASSLAFRCGFEHAAPYTHKLDGNRLTFTRVEAPTAEERKQLANAETVQLDTHGVTP